MISHRPTTTILLYHSIQPAGTCPVSQSSIPLDRLEEHLTALLEQGFQCVSLGAAFEELTSESPSQPPPKFAVTFDDGYESLHEYLPGLLPRIHPAVFLLTGCLGQSDMTWNTRSPMTQRHLSLAQVQDLARWGVDLEFHGTDHHNLLKFDFPQLCERFARGVGWFQEHLARKPRFIAYPYGCCGTLVQEVAAEYFLGGFSVTHGAWQGAHARYAINRISVPSYLSGDGVLATICAEPDRRWYERERRAPWRDVAR